MGKKILAWFMAVILMFGLVPVSVVQAAGEDDVAEALKHHRNLSR